MPIMLAPSETRRRSTTGSYSLTPLPRCRRKFLQFDDRGGLVRASLAGSEEVLEHHAEPCGHSTEELVDRADVGFGENNKHEQPDQGEKQAYDHLGKDVQVDVPLSGRRGAYPLAPFPSGNPV